MDSDRRGFSARPLLAIAFGAVLLSLPAACSQGGRAGLESPRHNRADAEFAQAMIPHHRQAISMAEMADGRASSVAVRRLAERITEDQLPEIRRMQSWFSDWNEPLHRGHHMPGMDDMGGIEPGMLSGSDMAALRHAHGQSFDRLFLAVMIEHHKGAIAMAHRELRTGRFPPAKNMARGIINGQSEEIRVMRALLER
ncbi:MAG TPA: DUF305 domain-containing protein [Actinomycetota bacterium]|jgi:uncharacterized protein (DUF305 family)|nr:DUF305 domain-containing protein [Actinomycetota bacterium]